MRATRRFLPHPVTSGALFVVWLLLNHTLSPGHMVLGAVLAVLTLVACGALARHRVREMRGLTGSSDAPGFSEESGDETLAAAAEAAPPVSF